MEPFPSPDFLPLDRASGRLIIRESFGIDHDKQIVVIECPPGVSAPQTTFHLRDELTGRILPAQRSNQTSGLAFLQLALRAGEELHLVPATGDLSDFHPSALSLTTSLDGYATVATPNWSVELFVDEWKSPAEAITSFKAPTPLRRMRIKDGPWRGTLFFDTHQSFRQITGTVLENGPLRIVTQFEAFFGADHSYVTSITLDADSPCVVVEESFHGDSGDQIVWDFCGENLPEQIYLLDSTAGFTTQSLHYFFDRRLARLACWNQYSQLHDYSDGYALGFSKSKDVIGFVALAGGEWSGNSHNFLEAWTRRWLPGDPLSRRLVPPEAKADASPSPEQIGARPVNLCESHFSIEGWLHRGRRRFALVLSSRDALRPPTWETASPLGHFETQPDRERYRQQQSLLRKIHIQRGLFSLTEQLLLNPELEGTSSHLRHTNPPWENPDNTYTTSDQKKPDSIPERIDQMLAFLASRIFGFWEGSGSAYTNAVVSRRLVHDLLDWEWLDANSYFTIEQSRQSRAWLIFLSALFSSDNYYPGAASMNLGDASRRLEPTIAGMANQNFFTDVFTLPGVAAQVFPTHPQATLWRTRFAAMWQQQLAYHVYPESGVWEESHTYFHHVLATILPALERRLTDDIADGFSEPAFQRLVGSLLKTLTPPDAYFANKRHVVALGDHGVDLKDLYRPLFRRLAHHLANINPLLAAQLAWAYQELGGKESLTIKPQALPWRSEYVQGLGYFFRAEDSRGESLMVLRCGTAWGHHHNDEGSLQFFYAGRSWVVDSAFSYPQHEGIRKHRADGHSRWAPRDIAPLNYLWQFNRGWITQHNDSPYPWAIAFTPVYMAETNVQQYIPLRHPILHWRVVIQLIPSVFLVLDRSDVAIPQIARMHVPVDTSVALENEQISTTPNLQLRLQSLSGWHPPSFATTDYPTQVPQHFATREIRFESNGQSVCAFLLSIESFDQPSTSIVQQDENRVRLTHPDFAAELDYSHPEKIHLYDVRSGLRNLIQLQQGADTST